MSWTRRVAARRWVWSALGGLMLAASFPKFGVAGLAWVAPALLLFAAVGTNGWSSFRIGYVGGLIYRLGSLYWLLWIPFPAGAVAGWIALSAYLALFPAAWVWLCWAVFPVCASDPSPGERGWLPSNKSILRDAPALLPLLALPAGKRILWALACAGLWVALEMILARLFTGFPWNILGVSQYQVVPVLQITEFTGVYGVSFLLIWFSVALGSAVLALLARPDDSRAWLPDLVLPLLGVVVVAAFGASELAGVRPAPRSLKAVLVQPSIPQTLIWDTNQNSIRFSQLVDLSEKALQATTNAQLLVWPEAAVPNMIRYDFDTYRAVTNLAMRHHVWVVLGSDDAVPRQGLERREDDFYNSSFLLDPGGEIRGVYRKRQLVIFGEYIPLERWVSFMKYLTPVGGSFTAGGRPRPFVIPDWHVQISVLICFEDVFPRVARQGIDEGTDFLLNVTNDGWFGESSAQWQQAANSVFRAVENRLPLVRCANNGLTCWIDAYGGLHDIFFPHSRDVYAPGFKVVDVPLLAVGEKHPLTFYTRHGDVFGWFWFTVSALLVGRCGWRWRRGRLKPAPAAASPIPGG